ncbi:phosphotransferase, partial [Pseudomonas sp. MAFF212428]|nr:phosphotransferase [Pseudomonas brassicae]
MPFATLVHRASLPCPAITREHALALLQEHYGMHGELTSLGSQQDLNFRFGFEGRSYVLKICHGDYAVAELQAQHAAVACLHQQGVGAPQVHVGLDGTALRSLAVDGQPIHARVLRYIDGQTLTRVKHFAPGLIAAFGRLCAEVDKALAAFRHPGLERTLQWDPRHAQVMIAHLLPVLAEGPRKARVQAAAAQAGERLAPCLAQLPMQAVHLDITDDNVVWQRDAQRQWQLQGVIDFGDLVHTWRIADLAVTCSALLHHVEGDPFRILPAIAAYHALNPLYEAELRALWPMIVARAAVLVLSGEQQVSVDPGNAYSRDNLAHEWQIFDVADSVPFELMEAAILQLAAIEPAPLAAAAALLPALHGQAVTALDLGVLSAHFSAGNWQQPGVDLRLLQAQPAPACTLYGQYRLSQTLIDTPREPHTCALHVALHLAPGTTLVAPFAGTWRHAGEGWACLEGGSVSLWLH